MRIATFNINSITRRLSNLCEWLTASAPDVVCLQELKVTNDAFPIEVLRRAGYDAVWRGERRWNGVAILARGRRPILIRDVLPGQSADTQCRYIEAAVDGIVVASLYAPNGNPRPGPKFDYKLDWTARLLDHAAGLLHDDLPVVLAGDFNIVPTDRDIHDITSWKTDALVQPEVRAAFQHFLDMGWCDALRTQNPDARTYTFWSYVRKRYERDAGLRLDHLLLSPAMAPRLIAAGVDRVVRGLPDASDHAPVWIDLDDRKKRRVRR